jgi:histidyl-tRNA synthetase
MTARAIAGVKGMNDLLPEESGRWHSLEQILRETVLRHGYQEIRTPIVEPTPLFVRSVGEGTDIVDKEMYSFVFHDESMTMRPEGTAGVVRAFIEHTLHGKQPVSRLFYIGPMFRGERPARGRYRQFHQAGCEVFGDAGPVVDAEMIDMLVGLLRRLEIENVEVVINSLGGAGAKDRYRARLVEHLTPLRDGLSDESQRRLASNPLRILDSKSPKDAAAIASAPSILEVIDDEDKAHFDALCGLLDALGTPYKVDSRLVRGLDYYTRTLFELRGRGGELGAQNALGGGGRYDRLVEELGGPSTPAVGFALGLERLLLAMPKHVALPESTVLLAPIGDRAIKVALTIAKALRAAGVTALVEGRGASLKAMLRRANLSGARVAVVIGDSELDRHVVQLKDLAAHTQREVSADALDVITHEIKAILVSPAPDAGVVSHS